MAALLEKEIVLRQLPGEGEAKETSPLPTTTSAQKELTSPSMPMAEIMLKTKLQQVIDSLSSFERGVIERRLQAVYEEITAATPQEWHASDFSVSVIELDPTEAFVANRFLPDYRRFSPRYLKGIAYVIMMRLLNDGFVPQVCATPTGKLELRCVLRDQDVVDLGDVRCPNGMPNKTAPAGEARVRRKKRRGG